MDRGQGAFLRTPIGVTAAYDHDGGQAGQYSPYPPKVARTTSRLIAGRNDGSADGSAAPEAAARR